MAQGRSAGQCVEWTAGARPPRRKGYDGGHEQPRCAVWNGSSIRGWPQTSALRESRARLGHCSLQHRPCRARARLAREKAVVAICFPYPPPRYCNPMHLNTRKERFSLAYINAVAARTGVVVSEPPVDQSSIDGTLMADFGRSTQINFQAKASSRDVMREDHVHFPLPRKNYDDLRRIGTVPLILIVVVLPGDNVESWLNQSEDELCMRRCGYWLSLEDREDAGNVSTVTVHVPRRNVFDSGQLTELMGKAARDEPL